MNKLLLINCLLVLFIASSCKDDDDHMHTGSDFEYHIHIMNPTSADKKVGDGLPIDVEVEDHNGGTVHHVNFRIYNKATGVEIYNKPSEAHVHEEDGMLEFTDSLMLNVDPHSDFIFVAKVWGHDEGVAEVKDSVEFHVHPN